MTLAFLNGVLLVSSYLIVDDTDGRDAIPTGARFEGLRVYSKASGLLFVLGAGLTNTDWQIIANLNPALFTVDPLQGIPIHSVYVEATGDDDNGEGTIAKPFLTLQKGMQATRGASPGFIRIKVGLGTFNADDGDDFGLIVQGNHQWGVSIQGTEVEVQDTAYVLDGAVPGKVSQARVDVGAYGFTPVEGEHFIGYDFAPNPEFATFLPVLASSASPKLDFVGPVQAIPATLRVVTLGTTITTSSGQLSVYGSARSRALTIEVAKVRSASGFISMTYAGFQSCDVQLPTGSKFISASGTYLVRGCYLSVQFQTWSDLNIYFLDNLCAFGRIDIYGTSSGGTTSFSRITSRSVTTNFFIGHRGFADTKPTGLFTGSIDFESGAGIDARGAATGLALQTDCTFALPCTRALILRQGARFQETSGSADMLGETNGVPVVLQTGGYLEDTVRIFDVNLTNAAVPGDEIKVGGNAPATFAGAPYTDFALGNTSQGCVAAL